MRMLNETAFLLPMKLWVDFVMVTAHVFLTGLLFEHQN